MKKTAILLFVASCLCGCIRGYVPKRSNEKANVIEPVDCGYGVYYFDAYAAPFEKSLGVFINANQGLEFVSMAPRVSGGDGCRTEGYYVVFRLNTNR